MPPRTRSSTGVIKQIVKYEESVFSDSMDLEDQPKKRSSRRVKSESASEFEESEESSASESASSQSGVVMSESGGDVTEDEIGDEFEFQTNISRPLIRRGKATVVDTKEGRLSVFPRQWLSRSQDELTKEIIGDISGHESAVAEVVYMSGRFKELCSKPNVSVAVLLKEMSNHLLHRLGEASITRARDVRDYSFTGLSEADVQAYFSRIQYVTSCLITGDLHLNTEVPTRTKVETYIPYWSTADNVDLDA